MCDPGYAFHDCSLPATIVTGVASFESVETIVGAGYRYYQFTSPANPRSNPWNYVASISTGGPSCSLGLYSKSVSHAVWLARCWLGRGRMFFTSTLMSPNHSPITPLFYLCSWFCMAADPYPFPGFVSAEYEDSDTSSPYLIDYFHDGVFRLRPTVLKLCGDRHLTEQDCEFRVSGVEITRCCGACV